MIGGSDQAWRRLELRHLLALDAVVRMGSFRSAARLLGYSQSAISDQIVALERIVGQPTLTRSRGGGRVAPTEAGRVLLEQLDGISSSIGRARDAIAALGEGGRVVRLGIYSSVAHHLLPALVRGLIETEPELEIRLEEAADDGELLRQVESGELDLTFATLPLVPGPFNSRELLSDPYALLVAADSPLADGYEQIPVPLVALADAALIDYRDVRAVHHSWPQLQDLSPPPHVVFRTDDNDTTHALVAAGVGVAILPRLSIDTKAPGVVVLELAPPLPARRQALVWRTDRSDSREVAAVVELAARIVESSSVSVTSVPWNVELSP